MTSARHPLPTDLVALVSFDGRVYLNEAKPWDRLGLKERANPLETALEQWLSFATGKHTWVSVRGATIRGLISARRRAKRTAWEVEVLIDAAGDRGIVLSLFSRMVAGIGKQGAERIFLRLDAGSHLVNAAREAGFFAYTEQTLYRLNGTLDLAAANVPFRARARGDFFGVFQLYNRLVPANVRAIEGATFREWQAALEPWGGRPTDLILEEDGVISGWSRLLSGQVGRFTVLAQGQHVSTDDLVQATIACIGPHRSLLALVPHHDAGAALALERLGFRPAGNYVVLARRLVKPSEELVPETASTAVPVN